MNGKGIYKTQMTGPLLVLGTLSEIEDSEAILGLTGEWIPRRRDSGNFEPLRLYPKTVGVSRQ